MYLKIKVSSQKRRKKSTGYNFDIPGNSLSDLSETLLEQEKNNVSIYRRERYCRTNSAPYIKAIPVIFPVIYLNILLASSVIKA